MRVVMSIYLESRFGAHLRTESETLSLYLILFNSNFVPWYLGHRAYECLGITSVVIN